MLSSRYTVRAINRVTTTTNHIRITRQLATMTDTSKYKVGTTEAILHWICHQGEHLADLYSVVQSLDDSVRISNSNPNLTHPPIENGR